MDMFYFFIQKEPALLDFLLEHSRCENNFVFSGETVEAFNCRQSYKCIQTEGVNDGVFLVYRYDVDGPVGNSGRHIVRYGSKAKLLENSVKMALEGSMNRPFASEGFRDTAPCSFEFLFPLLQIPLQLFTHSNPPDQIMINSSVTVLSD